MSICVVERYIIIRAMHLKGVVMDQQRVSTQVSLRSLRELTWAKAVCYRLIFLHVKHRRSCYDEFHSNALYIKHYIGGKVYHNITAAMA